MNARPTVFETKDELVQRAAVFVAGSLRAAVAERGRASLVLAGGSTPEPVYRLLASVHADAPFWADTHVFFGDERCVPPDHAHSNARMAREAMLNALPIPEAQVHRMVGEVHPPVAAYDYEQALNAYRAAARDPEAPLFDVVLLGLGDDGHTASLFPGEAALEEAEALCVHTQSPPASPVDDRLTLTFPALADAQTVLFLVTGANKQAALHAALHGLPLPDQTEPVPASRVTARGEVLWFVDRAAAAEPAG
ncbi:MAG: 6-phosphogluconolactonase [Bacteroidota bacterium]